MSIFDYKDSFKEIEDIPCTLVWESPDRPLYPKVSIIMPVYINHEFFKLALESALNQDWNGSYEIVVVDNDTSENNPNQKIIEELNDPRVRYFRNAENIGMVGNWNRGVIKASAPLVTFLHDDDMFLPTTLSNAMSASKKYPGKMIISSLRYINSEGRTWVDDSEYTSRRFGIFTPREIGKVSFARSLCLNLGNCVGSIFNRENLISLGGFHADSYPIPDYEMMVRYIYNYGAVNIRLPNALYRFANNTSAKVYMNMGPKQHEIELDMIERINLPYWMMHRIADTYFKLIDTGFRNSFAPPEHHVHHHISIFDRVLTTMYRNLLNLIEAYRIG